MRRALVTVFAAIIIIAPATSNAAAPSFPHLSPPRFSAPLVNGFFTLTWLGQWKNPPRPEFTDLPRTQIIDTKKWWLNSGTSVFPKCSKEIVLRCISSIEYKKSGQTIWSSANFIGYLPVTTLPFEYTDRDRYVKWSEADIDHKRTKVFPLDSARSSLWEMETTLGKQKYLATVSIQYFAPTKEFSQFRLSLTPVIEINVKNESIYKELDPNNSWCARTGYGNSFSQGSNFHPLEESNRLTGDYDYCLVNSDFDRETKFRINTQLSSDFSEKQLANWVTSRTTETRAYSKSAGASKPVLASFEGGPVKVQAGVTQVPRTLDGFNSFYAGNPYKKEVDQGKLDSNWLEGFKQNFGIGSDRMGGQGEDIGWAAITQWETTEKYIDPNLTLEQNLWNFSVIPLVEDGDNWVSRCKKTMNSASSFSGVISTNATVFVQGPPKLESSGDLNFQVAGTHLKQNGDKNIGSYNLSIDKNVAKCIWGTSSLGASASISVTSQDGVKQVATTSIGLSENQLNFSASGFDYSIKKIAISIGARKSTATNSMSKTTITCGKGNISKKVTALKPKCPAGYKKK
jgi:hypothetical protein